MSNILTKEDIIGGITKEQLCRIESLDGSIYLRPLSESEISKLREEEADAYGNFETLEKSQTKGRRQIKGETENKAKINVQKTMKSTNEVRRKKILMSLDNESNKKDKWTLQDIGNIFNEKQVLELAEKVDEISGVNVTDEDVEDFPENK